MTAISDGSSSIVLYPQEAPQKELGSLRYTGKICWLILYSNARNVAGYQYAKYLIEIAEAVKKTAGDRISANLEELKSAAQSLADRIVSERDETPWTAERLVASDFFQKLLPDNRTEYHEAVYKAFTPNAFDHVAETTLKEESVRLQLLKTDEALLHWIASLQEGIIGAASLSEKLSNWNAVPDEERNKLFAFRSAIGGQLLKAGEEKRLVKEDVPALVEILRQL